MGNGAGIAVTYDSGRDIAGARLSVTVKARGDIVASMDGRKW